MNILTPEDLAKMLKLPRRSIIEIVAKQDGFPQSITGTRKLRWLEDAVLEFFKNAGGNFPPPAHPG